MRATLHARPGVWQVGTRRYRGESEPLRHRLERLSPPGEGTGRARPWRLGGADRDADPRPVAALLDELDLADGAVSGEGDLGVRRIELVARDRVARPREGG